MTIDNTQAMQTALEALQNSYFDLDKRQAACAALIKSLSMTTQAQPAIAPEFIKDPIYLIKQILLRHQSAVLETLKELNDEVLTLRARLERYEHNGVSDRKYKT